MFDIEFIIKIFERNFYINNVIINEKAYYNEQKTFENFLTKNS